MKRMKRVVVKRIGTQGRHSIYYKIWNDANPNDPIIPNIGYIIHHKDGNPNNNTLENLEKMTDSQHKKLHTNNGNHPNQGKKFSEELRKKLSKAHIGQIPWNKGKVCSEKEHQRLIEMCKNRKPSYGMLGKKWSEETREKMKKRIPWNKGLKMKVDGKKNTK